MRERVKRMKAVMLQALSEELDRFIEEWRVTHGEEALARIHPADLLDMFLDECAKSAEADLDGKPGGQA